MIRWKHALNVGLGLLCAAMMLFAQSPRVVAIRAGRLFDPKSGTNLINQVVLISGDKITEVGPAGKVTIPAGAKVIDLSKATVLPGLIDGHVHLTDEVGGRQHHLLVCLNSAQDRLNTRYLTQATMG